MVNVNGLAIQKKYKIGFLLRAILKTNPQKVKTKIFKTVGGIWNIFVGLEDGTIS